MNILSKVQISNLPMWLPIQGFEGLYEVNCREGIVRNARTLKVLKPSPDSNGYPIVTLIKDGRHYTKTIHRIVATVAFRHYNIQTDGLLVMHLDEERFNPKVSNLALGTAKENMNFPKVKERESESNRGEKAYWFGKHLSAEVKKKLSDAQPKKAVGAYKNGKLILKFESVNDAGRYGFNKGNVSLCCSGKHKSHHGYEWKYLTA